MTYEEIINYFKSPLGVAENTGYSRSNIYTWKRRGFIPINAQYKLQVLTKGKLKAEDSINK